MNSTLTGGGFDGSTAGKTPATGLWEGVGNGENVYGMTGTTLEKPVLTAPTAVVTPESAGIGGCVWVSLALADREGVEETMGIDVAIDEMADDIALGCETDADELALVTASPEDESAAKTRGSNNRKDTRKVIAGILGGFLRKALRSEQTTKL